MQEPGSGVGGCDGGGAGLGELTSLRAFAILTQHRGTGKDVAHLNPEVEIEARWLRGGARLIGFPWKARLSALRGVPSWAAVAILSAVLLGV